MEQTITLTTCCHCGAASHSFAVPASSLPLPTYLCNCNTSRRCSGSLLTSYVNITHPTDLAPCPPNPDIVALTPYQSSTQLTRWFCRLCGTHMYLQYHDDGHFEAATGTLSLAAEQGEERIDVGRLVQVKGTMWIGDTVDGGASSFISEIDGRVLERWHGAPGQSEQRPPDWPSTCLPPITNGTAMQEHGNDAAVHAHCHCHGVEFWITHPSDASTLARSPFPDLLVPHHLNGSANPSNTTWWLPSPTTYLAGTCACNSCRRASGFDITFWAFVPTANIFLDAALREPFPHDAAVLPPAWGTMKSYSSSEGVTRTFCGRCGANIMWSGSGDTHGREGLVDVAVGLLDGDGARAQGFLRWCVQRVSFAEEAKNRRLIEGLEAGLEEWAGRGRRGEDVL